VAKFPAGSVYVAVTVWVPALKVMLGGRLAWPPTRATVVPGLPSILMTTLPLGVPPNPDVLATVAVKITGWPNAEVTGGMAVTVVLVDAGLTR
jgi:hypothetical protein